MTEYGGHQFREPLAARWAIFFDKLNIPWSPEIQGFELPTQGRYLPDFYLPGPDLLPQVEADEDDFHHRRHLYAEAVHHLGLTLLVLGPIPDTRHGTPQHLALARHDQGRPDPVLCVHIAWADMLTVNTTVGEQNLACTDLETDLIDLPPLGGYNRGPTPWTCPEPAAGMPSEKIYADAYRAARAAPFGWGDSP